MRSQGLGQVVFSEEQIKQRIEEIAQAINQDYQGMKLVIVCVLKGAIYFVADLTRQLTMPLSMDFLSIGVSHDQNGKNSVVKFTKDLDISITGQNVLLVEDVVGTGFTLGYIYQHLESYQPASLKICTLLDSPDERLLTLPITYRCFIKPDTFVVGYGLDYKQQYRNLPYIAEYRR